MGRHKYGYPVISAHRKRINTSVLKVMSLAIFILICFTATAQKRSKFNQPREDGKVRSFKDNKEAKKMFKKFGKRMSKFKSQLKTASAELSNFSVNYFIPGWKTNLADKNWYGSGDMDGNNIINMADYDYAITQNVSFDPFNDGTHKADLNLNGQSYDSEDLQILWSYLQGEKSHINVFELETTQEQETHFMKAKAIDPTNLVDANAANWLCYDFTAQLFINFNGAENISTSSFAENNGTNLQYDLSHNGMFRIPVKFTSTFTDVGIAHEINMVYLSRLGNEDVRKFDYRLYVEPQNDEIKVINSFSLNQIAKEFWHGVFETPSSGLVEGARRLTEYDISSGQAVETYSKDGLVETFNALEGIVFSPSKTLEYYVGIENDIAEMVRTELPENMTHPDYTIVNKVTSSDQENSGFKKYNFRITEETDLVTGKFTSGNSLGGSNVRFISLILKF